MSYSPTLLLHIASGTLGMLSGFVAVFLRKGSRRHGMVGNVFVVSMLILGASGVYLAFASSKIGNVPGGALTFYLVATAWMTARRRDAETSVFDWAALLFSLAIAAVTVTWGIEAARSSTGMQYGYPPGPYFFLGVVTVLAIVGDARVLVRHGISGTQRIARHLWRMCFALFVAASSIFLARAQVFPVFLQKTGALVFLSVLPLLLMIFWLIRVRFEGAYRRMTMAAGEVYSLRAQGAAHAAAQMVAVESGPKI